jgi:hypothetical protein
MTEETILLEGKALRQVNGTAFFPQHIWEALKIETNEEFDWTLERRNKGSFIAFYKRTPKK